MLWNGKSSDENARNLPIFLHSRVYWNLFFYGPVAGGRTAIWSGRVNKHKNITDQWRLEYLITFMKFMSIILENNYEWLIRMTFSCESLSFSLPIKDQRFQIPSVFPLSRWFLRFPYRHGPTRVESSEKFKIHFKISRTLVSRGIPASMQLSYRAVARLST